MNRLHLSPSNRLSILVLFGPLQALVGAGVVFGLWMLFQESQKQGLLFTIGLGLGIALYYGSFGFTAAYRNAFVKKDVTGVIAQIIMIGLATVLFAPILAEGNVFGHGVSGAWAPLGWQVAVGSFIFGIGMQLGGACASGTLFSVGGGSMRMVITLIFFCLGAFFGSLHLGWWGQLGDVGVQSLGHLWGWDYGVAAQLILLGLIAYGLKKWSKGRAQTVLWDREIGLKNLLLGPWPLLLSALVLAALNFATLLVAGHPWSITWAFTLWGAKMMTFLGWTAQANGFWTAPFQSNALAGSLFVDNTSLMNIALLCGAFGAAILSRRFEFKIVMNFKSIMAAVIGGLLMGYGARLAYGCNIGALFSGMASTSLHAWLWIICALAGTWIGIRLRPVFGLGG